MREMVAGTQHSRCEQHRGDHVWPDHQRKGRIEGLRPGRPPDRADKEHDEIKDVVVDRPAPNKKLKHFRRGVANIVDNASATHAMSTTRPTSPRFDSKAASVSDRLDAAAAASPPKT